VGFTGKTQGSNGPGNLRWARGKTGMLMEKGGEAIVKDGKSPFEVGESAQLRGKK